MRHSVILVFANKQDLPGALSTAEVCQSLGLTQVKNRMWHVQSSVATRGEGLYEGLDWLSATLKSINAGTPAKQ
jgi:Arf/Sar family protein